MADLSELLGRTLVLVAHPDDETAGCGALLQRADEPVVVFATDGAPHDRYFWEKYGSRQSYGQLREEEARQAMLIAGVAEVELMGNELGIPDQTLHQHLKVAYGRLSESVGRRRPDSLLTLAYEGGHPDHDCCSILAAQLGVQFGVPVWEFPLYHRAGGQLQYQQFLDPRTGRGTAVSPQVSFELTPEELAKKREMLNAYASQHPFLLEFESSVERFRPQAKYDYARPPHEGVLNYEAWGWAVKGADLCAACGEFISARCEVMR